MVTHLSIALKTFLTYKTTPKMKSNILLLSIYFKIYFTFREFMSKIIRNISKSVLYKSFIIETPLFNYK